MSIDKIGYMYDEETYDVMCDNCDTVVTHEVSTFWDLIDKIKEDGWLVRKEDGEWCHYCYECQENEGEAR